MQLSLGLLIVSALTALVYVFNWKNTSRRRVPGKKIDIEIRYETEKDADATLLAQNIAKVVRMVLVPIESQIKKEDAKLILVMTGDSWEMRMRKASDNLKSSVRSLLDAKEW